MLLPTRVRLVLALSPILALAPASAQKVPPPAPPARPVALSADGAFAAQKAAFLSLPLESRKAAQDALVWLGFYNGASDGDFGKRTRDAIVGWQRSHKAAGDGVLSAGELTTLMAAAEKAREAAGFAMIDDKKTGARIGAPSKLMAARGGPRLDLAAGPNADLAALYQRLSAGDRKPQGGLQGDEAGPVLRRLGAGGADEILFALREEANANPPVRGFTFAYPAARAICSTASRSRWPVRSRLSPNPMGRRRHDAVRCASACRRPAASAEAVRDGPRHWARAGADGAQARRLPESQDRRQARPFRTDRRGTGLAILAGDFAARGGPPRLGALEPDLVVLSAGGDRIGRPPHRSRATRNARSSSPRSERRRAAVRFSIAPAALPASSRRCRGAETDRRGARSPRPILSSSRGVGAFLGGRRTQAGAGCRDGAHHGRDRRARAARGGAGVLRPVAPVTSARTRSARSNTTDRGVRRPRRATMTLARRHRMRG